MSSGSPSNLPKAMALGAAYLAYKTWDHRNNFDMHEAHVEESSMYANDRLHHAQQAYYDGPDTTGMLWLKHAILDPANWHFIKRPMIYVKGLVDSVVDNAVPLGLAVCALTWGFGGSMSKVIGGTLHHSLDVLGYMGKGLGAVWDASRTVFKGIQWPKMPKLGPKETLGMAAVGALGVYYLGLFTKVMTGQVKDDIYTPLDPVSLEEAMEPGGGH